MGIVEGLPLPLTGGIAGLVALAAVLPYLLIARGRLVSRTTVEDMRADYQRAIDDICHDRDEWRAAHRISEQARLEEREHNAALVTDVANPVKEFLAAFRRRAGITGGEETP